MADETVAADGTNRTGRLVQAVSTLIEADAALDGPESSRVFT